MTDNYWDFWWGGLAIAAVAVSITVVAGKFLSVTRGYASLCGIISRRTYFHRPDLGGRFGYRTLFILGVVLGGFLAALTEGGWDPQWNYGMFDELYGTNLAVKIIVLLVGGIFWGYGSRLAGGCTSGNSISGISRGALSSVVATLGFMVAGVAATFTLNGILGGL